MAVLLFFILLREKVSCKQTDKSIFLLLTFFFTNVYECVFERV